MEATVKTLAQMVPFPFDLPQGQELLKVLGQTYPRSKAVEQIAEEAGFQLAKLPLDDSAHDLLHRMLEQGAVSGRVQPLIETVLRNEPNHVRARFLRKLLTEPLETIAIDAGPVEPGSAQFLRGTNDIDNKEALLFHDDLMITVASIPQLVASLRCLGEAAKAVCRLSVNCPAQRQHGTGFRIADDLILTNWHVLNFDGAPTTAVEARFHYDDDGEGQPKQTQAIAGDLSSIQGDQGDDWAVIRLTKPIPSGVPVTSLKELGVPRLDEPAFVIQHPGGGTKRLSFVRNTIFFTDNKVVQYLSDTQQGSSGAPVFDKQCRLIAIHRQGGSPQIKAGKPPMKKNEGLRASVVAEGLADKGIYL